MQEERPLPFTQVLADEYKTLRGADVSAGSQEEFFRKTGATPSPLSALCISGGGIRSATFALGALQALAKQGVLQRFDYLSTVSGGGYIGSWLTSWINRAGGLDKIVPQLSGGAHAPLPSDTDPVRHLREYNSYLTPRLGAFSADTWTLVATVVRNIMLNWLVLVPLLLGALMIPRALLSIIMLGQLYFDLYGNADPVAKSPIVIYGLPVAGAVLIAMVFFNIGRYLPGAGGRNHAQGDFLRKVLAPLTGASLCFIAHESLFFWTPEDIAGKETSIWLVICWILAPAAAGWLLYLTVSGKSFREWLRLLFGPLTGAVIAMAISAGLAAWVVTNKVLPSTSWALYLVIAPPLLVLAFDFGGSIFVGLASRILEDPDREWMARSSAWLQLFCVYWVAISALVLLAPEIPFHWKTWQKTLFAVVSAVSAWLSRSSGSVEPPEGKTESRHSPGRLLLKYAIRLAPVVFIVTFAIGLSVLTNLLLFDLIPVAPSFMIHPLDERTGPSTWWDHKDLIEHTPWQLATICAILFFAMSRIMARFININKFSLHDMYRNRLIRAYLGASNSKRNASPFTGFSENDNLRMCDLNTGLRPFHVVNVALNLVAGKRLDWQQRKARSFTISALHAGNDELGYRNAAKYGDGVSLGTAMTISGAAASPNMGYHSSPAVGFIMTLLNARLGAWLGNPGEAGASTWKQAGPHSAVASLVREAFGLTNDTSSYVYLSDGGHFENLGLYEMVRRGCRCIMVLDAGADADYTYEDLGNALRKIRIDMNIAIEFDDLLLSPLRERKRRCAVATIRYSALDPAREDGFLIYVKPIIQGNESPDVATYKAKNSTFPHESTADQWFNESQTESYRKLGHQTIMEICQGWDGTWEGLRKRVAENYLGKYAATGV
jgi:hypothetical protein